MAELSLRSRVSVIALIAMLPVVVAACVFGWLYVRSRIDERTTDLERTAVGFAEVINTRLVATRALAERLADAAPGPEHLEALRRHAQIAIPAGGGNLVVHGLDGRKLLDTSQREATPSSPTSLQMVARVLESGGTLISPLYKGQSGEWRMSVFTPLRQSGKVWAVLALGVVPSSFGEVISRRGMLSGSRWGMVDVDGTVLARSHEPDKHVGTKIPSKLQLRDRSDTGVSWDSDGVSGQNVVRAWTRVPATGWLVAVVLPQALILEPFYFALSLFVSMFAAATAVALIVMRTLVLEFVPEDTRSALPDGPFAHVAADSPQVRKAA